MQGGSVLNRLIKGCVLRWLTATKFWSTFGAVGIPYCTVARVGTVLGLCSLVPKDNGGIGSFG